MMQKPGIQLSLQTSNLFIGFMIWVLISSLMPSIQEDIALTAGQASLITAIPVILGSVLRIPIGFYTNRYGAKQLFILSFILLLFPVFYISVATSFIDLVIGGLILGIAGATFSIGVTSLPKYYPKEQMGFVNGIYAVGNLGTAVTTFAAPVLAVQIGWQSTVRLYLILLLIFIVVTFVLGDRAEAKVRVSMAEQVKSVYKNTTLWFLSLFYFITFGAFVAFTVFLPSFLVNNFDLTPVDAGLRTAGFILLATLMRPIGGFLADKFNPFIILMFTFVAVAFSGILLSFSPNLLWYSVGALAVAVSVGIGNGTVFKLVPLYFSKQSGIVNGIVSAMGGLGGFFPPLLLTTVFNITGHYAIAFMLLSELAIVCFIIVIFMYYQEKVGLEKNIIDSLSDGVMLTDKNGVIQEVNTAFTTVTGYEKDEVIGEKPSILSSGKHGPEYYAEMWKTIEHEGFWNGEIWNKRKNGDVYKEKITINAIENSTGDVKFYAGMFTEIK